MNPFPKFLDFQATRAGISPDVGVVRAVEVSHPPGLAAGEGEQSLGFGGV